MRRSKYYNMRLPERGAREGEANDAADIEDLTYDLEIIDKEMERQRLEDVRMEKEKATKLELSQHKSAAVLDHPDNSVTDAKLGQRTVLTTSGPLQTLLTAIGNAIKAISGADTWNGTPATTLTAARAHMDSKSNPHGVTKTQVGLGNADNTSDANKPVSTAMRTRAIHQIHMLLPRHRLGLAVCRMFPRTTRRPPIPPHLRRRLWPVVKSSLWPLESWPHRCRRSSHIWRTV